MTKTEPLSTAQSNERMEVSSTTARRVFPPAVRKIGHKLRRYQRRAINASINNLLINNLAIRLRFERWLKDFQHPYRWFVPKADLTLQQNAGFSDRPEINQALARTHADLAQAAAVARSNVGEGNLARVLDIGCGPGLYLTDFPSNQFDLTGIDISSGMCGIARERVPHATVIEGDFIQVEVGGPFDLIYSIGVFMYISRMDLDAFFEKVYRSLRPGGVFFLNYQHALSYWDLAYPDLTYIQYSPLLVERMASRRLEIIEQRHAFDNRAIGLYDRTPHQSLNPNARKTFLNSSVLVARRPR